MHRAHVTINILSLAFILCAITVRMCEMNPCGRYVDVPLMAHFGNHILPIMVDMDMPILVESQKWLTWHSFLYRVTNVVFYQNWLIWHSFLYRVIDVVFYQKWFLLLLGVPIMA